MREQGWTVKPGRETTLFVKAIILGFSLGRCEPTSLNAEEHVRWVTRMIFARQHSVL